MRLTFQPSQLPMEFDIKALMIKVQLGHSWELSQSFTINHWPNKIMYAASYECLYVKMHPFIFLYSIFFISFFFRCILLYFSFLWQLFYSFIFHRCILLCLCFLWQKTRSPIVRCHSISPRGTTVCINSYRLKMTNIYKTHISWRLSIIRGEPSLHRPLLPTLPSI